MKIRDVAIDYLESHGLFRDQAVAAIGAPKTHLVNIWDDDIAGYPSAFHALVQLEAKRLALDWIDATMPKHFAQYVLDPKRMERDVYDDDPTQKGLGRRASAATCANRIRALMPTRRSDEP